MLLVGVAWSGGLEAMTGILIPVCLSALVANFYASWHQTRMVWLGGLILIGCYAGLWLSSAGFNSDEIKQIPTLFSNIWLPIYASSFAGGLLGSKLNKPQTT